MYLLKAVGADPEFFLQNADGDPVTAIGLIGGSKKNPKFINKDGFSAIQEDNVMVEFNIRPARSADEFRNNITSVMEYLMDEVLKPNSLLADISPSVEFTTAALEHHQAKEIGCEGDFNAWTNGPNPQLSADVLKNLRTAGGHVHVSFDVDGRAPRLTQRVMVVRAMDLALGIPALLLDDDYRRREFYGKAGAFRPKKYGVEYRTLSNFWIKSPVLMEWVFNQVKWVFDQINNNDLLTRMVPDVENQIQGALRIGCKKTALKLMQSFEMKGPDNGILTAS